MPWVFYIYSRSELAGHALVSQIASRSRGLHFHFFSYLGAVLYTTLPWVLVIFSNLKKNIKMIAVEARSQHLLVLLSIAIPILFFCFWGRKGGNRYILPSLLLFLILLSRILSDTGHIFNKVKYMGLVILSVLIVLFFVLSRTPHVYTKLLNTKHIVMPGFFNLPYLILILLPVSYFFCSRRGVFSIRIFAMHFFIFFISASFFLLSTINNISNFKQFSNSIKKSEYPVFLFKQTVENMNFLSLVIGRGNTLTNYNDKDGLLLAMKKNQKSTMYITTTGCLNKDRKVSYYLRKHTLYTLCSNE